jgi:hypothetical protein
MPPLDEKTLGLTTQLWLDALNTANVPTNLFRSLLAQCLANREWDGPVGVDAIIKQYRQHLAAQPTKTIQELDRETGRDMKALPAPSADSPARAAYLLLGERMKAGKGNVACECGNAAILSFSGAQWQCAEHLCSFHWPTADTLNAPHAGKAGPLAFGLDGNAPKPQAQSTHSAASLEPELEPLTDAALLDALAERCKMATGKIEPDTALQFGRHLLSVAPLDLWTQQVARREWAKFTAVAA